MSITANPEKTNVNVIRIDDGLRRIPIENMFGQEVGVFFFRPTDLGIMERYNKLKQTHLQQIASYCFDMDGLRLDGMTFAEYEKAWFEGIEYLKQFEHCKKPISVV